MSYGLSGLVLLSLASWFVVSVESATVFTYEVVTMTTTSSCSTSSTGTPVVSRSGIPASSALSSSESAAPLAISKSAAPSMATTDLASLCLAYSERASLSAMATGGVANSTMHYVNSTMLYANSSMLPPDVPAPDWTLAPGDLTLPPAIPEPSPQPISNTATAQLIRTVQDLVLKNYEAYATFSCFEAGNTLDCSGPWLYADQWDNDTLSGQVTQNTVVDPSYYCSYDTTYLQSSDFDRIFYGFSAANITDSLQSMANITSLWAAGACTLNSSCAATYQNDTEQMFSDFRGYIQSSFFDFMTTALQNDSLSYCPSSITGPGSLLTYATSYFDGSKEYFGLHNPIFVDGVAESINGTLEEARLELGLSLANNARRAEAVFLNMIFFTPLPTTTPIKRSVDDEEVYPGCRRREYVMKGSCDGVLPPREFDLAGEFISMKDRDRIEVLGLNPRGLKTTGLVLRDTSCAAQQSSIAASISALQKARDAFSIALDFLSAAQVIILGAEVGGGLSIFIFGLALPELLALMFIAECEPFHTCDGLPPAGIDIAKAIAKAQAGLASKFFANKAGVKNLIGVLKQVISTRNFPSVEAAAASGVGLIVGFGGGVIEKLLANAQKYFEGALACCAANCASSTCTQASLKCILSFGNQWSGSGGLRCDAT